MKELFENNQAWCQSKIDVDPKYFIEMAKGQKPRYFWVGCADSRVPANEIVGLNPGELFVQRNVANLFPHTDFNCLSALAFAVGYLKVEHVIVCGHTGCGGVRAAMEGQPLGLIDNWLRYIRDTYTHHKATLDQITDPDERANRLAEFNVFQQVANICHTTVVQEAWAAGQPLTVHGLIYELGSDRLKDLNCSVSKVSQIDAVYRINI